MSRGACVPRSVVRPSAAFDRGPVVPRPRVDRRVSASGLGSRVPWRGVASWAGRSASSGLSGILSCRPRGDLVSTPRGTQTRRAPDSARRVFVRRMIRPASKECQTSGACDVEGDGPAPGAGSAGSSLETVGRPERARQATMTRVRTLPSLSAAPVRTARAPILPGGIAKSPCRARRAGAILSGPSAPGTLAEHSGTPFRNPETRAITRCSGRPSSRRSRPPIRSSGDLATPPSTVIPRHRRIRSNEWTRSRSGEPPWVSCRFPCRPPTTRPGSAIPSSSMSTTSGSRSPSRTASRRTGLRPAIAR